MCRCSQQVDPSITQFAATIGAPLTSQLSQYLRDDGLPVDDDMLALRALGFQIPQTEPAPLLWLPARHRMASTYSQRIGDCWSFRSTSQGIRSQPVPDYIAEAFAAHGWGDGIRNPRRPPRESFNLEFFAYQAIGVPYEPGGACDTTQVSPEMAERLTRPAEPVSSGLRGVEQTG